MNDKNEQPVDLRDDVARLMRLAGKRRAVPHERAERVRAAARAQWQHEVRLRYRKRFVWTAAGLATAASLTLLIAIRLLSVGSGGPGSDLPVRVEALAGAAWGRLAADTGSAERRALEVGDELRQGSELTTAEESRATIRLASGHSVRLDTVTRIRLLDAGSFALDRGAVYVDSGSERVAAGSLRVETPLGRIREIGTQFEARLQDGSLRVRLREGAVVVSLDDRSHEVKAGSELEMGPGGSVVRRTIPTHGSDWEWLVGITPMIELEGRSARAFLDWVARERGWTLAFADESVARAADEIVLGGTVGGLTLDEALDAVLPTCRMTYRVDKGVLVVAALPEA